jgi:hypothetical protein
VRPFTKPVKTRLVRDNFWLNVQLRIVIVDVLDCLGTLRVSMDLIKEEVCSPLFEEVIRQIKQAVG